jgi:5-(aminomethyl)-3-furanmethanol phosphate kinase
MTAPLVVKVGGSLFDLPDLGPRLEAWLKTLHQREIILVAGGGAAADVIREMDRIHRLGEEKSHWLALRSLSLMAQTLTALLPGSTPVLDLLSFAAEDESRPERLPHRWDVTSDSLAARLAEVIESHELILLKSVTIPPEMNWAEASRRGYVDGYFPTMIARGVKARAVNLREWRP